MNISNKTRTTLGVVAICYNEERDLPGFLKHLIDWVDEIVLVDDGSTDSSREIATAYGSKVKFIVSPREAGEYFSHQRNKGIDAAKSEWLLHLDIDERITPKLKLEILKAITDDYYDAYKYHRLNFFMHRPVRGCGWQLWSQLHLARREKFRFGGYMHEEEILTDPKSRSGKLKEKMWHYNEDTYEKRLVKSLKYTKARAQSIIDSGKKVRSYELILRPLLAFVKTYFLFLGFRDGLIGWVISFHDMATTFDAYLLVWNKQNMIPREALEQKFAQLQ